MTATLPADSPAPPSHVAQSSEVAESWRLENHVRVEIDGRQALGQFLTPASVANQMVEMFGPLPREVHLLDAGAGVGALVAAFVGVALRRAKPPRSIHVTAFELDDRLLAPLAATLSACHAECLLAGVAFSASVRHEDFVLAATDGLWSAASSQPRINRVVLNPPYLKIASDSYVRSAIRAIGLDTGNLYSAFVGLALELLEDGGELVAITPRSFCNGPYFAPFRHFLLERASFLNAHVFESRRSAFSEDTVLQENIIFRLRRGPPQPRTVMVGVSAGPGGPASTRRVKSDELVRPTDPDKFIHLVPSREGAELADRIRSLPSTLAELGLTVSTGRVVDFRSRASLVAAPESGAVPLIYPVHFSGLGVTWPRSDSRKPNALMRSEATEAFLVEAGHYVLTKRFTSKEEARRIVAVTISPADVPGEAYAFENHLNYFHASGRGLREALARGLALYLNSSAVDEYFRQFSGHTQVNATDLRSLRYPNTTQLQHLGSVQLGRTRQQDAIDRAVEATLWPTLGRRS